MDPLERKKVTVITKYASATFTEGDWLVLGQISGKLSEIQEHSRLFRSMSFGDDDYEYCVAEVLSQIFTEDPNLIPEVINHFDIDLWYEQKEPEKYKRIFISSVTRNADFWDEGHLKLFISHLAENKEKMSALKSFLSHWGISAFVAHEDIEPSREWLNEVEVGQKTMEVMIAVVQPGFKDSDWCAQEVGFALGRKIDVIPLRAGLDPFGFFGKYQGIPIKGKVPSRVACEVTKLLLKKPKYRKQLLQSMPKAFSQLASSDKLKNIKHLEEWSIISDEQMKALLEGSALSASEKISLNDLIAKVKAFPEPKQETAVELEEDLPF